MATGIDMLSRGTRGRHGNGAATNADAGRVALDPAHLMANAIFGLNRIDPRARPFILLCSQLLNGFHAAGGRSLAISSTQPGNGKTFVTANLALALSRAHPVILLDLDLSQPTLCERLGLAPGAGVDDYLAGDVPLERAIHRVAGLDLAVLPVRQRRLRTAGLLSGNRLTELFAWARSANGKATVIVDTPPTLAIDDMLAIAAQVDGVLLVVEEGRTRGDELRETVRMLQPTPVIGAVLNKSISGIFNKKSREYYKYSRDISEVSEES